MCVFKYGKTFDSNFFYLLMIRKSENISKK